MSDPTGDLLDDAAAARLLIDLGDALASEIRTEHIEAAMTAFWVGRTDALIAELEQHLDAEERAGVRGGRPTQQRTYRHDDVSVSLTIDDADQRVDGRLDGRWSSARWLDGSGSAHALDIDTAGRFRFPLRRGPVAIEVALHDGRTLRTSWTLL